MDFQTIHNISTPKITSYTGEVLGAMESLPYFTLIWPVTMILPVCVLWVWIARDSSPLSNIPMLGSQGRWDISGKAAKEHWMANCRGVVLKGFNQVGASRPFRVLMDLGEMLILPPSMADEIRNVEAFSHGDFMVESTCANVPGFEPYLISTASDLLTILTKTKLTSHLKQITQPMSDCVADACPLIFSDDEEWHETVLKSSLLDLIARLSSVIFLGDESVSSDDEWLRLTKEYTVDSFIAAHQLRMYPHFLWNIVAKILPSTRKVYSQFKRAEEIINPIVERRRKEHADGSLERLDAVEWAEQIAQERGIKYSPAAAQLNMALSAIHTTTDLITTTMYEILTHPGTVEELRKEIISVIKDEGLKHSSLYELKLMDSVIKEAQRLKPVLSVNMVRKAKKPVTLPTSKLHVPAGTRLGVPANASWDPSVFPTPESFHADRFVRLREQDDHWQLTSLRSEQIAFGLGKHACPGRFLAANELKIALCHLLMKFEWEMGDGAQNLPVARSNGIMLDSDPNVRVWFHARIPEVGI